MKEAVDGDDQVRCHLVTISQVVRVAIDVENGISADIAVEPDKILGGYRFLDLPRRHEVE